MSATAVTAAITAQNTFTSSVSFSVGLFDLSVSGTFSATVTLQRSFDSGSTWHDVETFTAAEEAVVDNADNTVKWRIGVKTGQFTSGTANVRLSQ